MFGRTSTRERQSSITAPYHRMFDVRQVELNEKAPISGALL
jgi:hypothetical protein